MRKKLIRRIQQILSTPPFASFPSEKRERLRQTLLNYAAAGAARAGEKFEEGSGSDGETEEFKSAENLSQLAAVMNDDRALLSRMGQAMNLAPQRTGLIGSSGPSTALVLSGGGSKGSFEVGALYYLEKKWSENAVNYVCGSSVGAVNALAISTSGKAGIKRLVQVYLSLYGRYSMYNYSSRMNTIDGYLRDGFNTSLDQILGGDAAQTAIDATLQTIDMYDTWFTRLTTYTTPIIGQILAAGALWSTLDRVERALTYVKSILKEVELLESVYVLDPIEAKISTAINFDRAPVIPLRMATTSLENGKVHYMDEAGDLHIGAASPNAPGYGGVWNLEGSRKQNLIDGAIASASIPGIFPARQLRANPWTLGHFVDGGVREAAPFKAAAELGVQRIIAILASPLDVTQIGINQIPKMGNNVSRSLEILTNEVATNESMPVPGWSDGVERILIFPEILVHGTMVVQPGLIEINMAYGYMRAHDQYLGQTNQLGLGESVLGSILAQEITELRTAAWKLEESILAMRLSRPQSAPTPGDPDPLVVFDKAKIDDLRELKKMILDRTVERFKLFGKNPACIPIDFVGDDGGGLNIHDWWSTWERHLKPGLGRLGLYNLWKPLPYNIGPGIRRGFEDVGSVPAKPTTNLF